MQALARLSGLLAAATIVLGVPPGAAGPASISLASEAFQLAPHRAVYDVTLIDARGGSGISGMTGRMVYEFSGAACEGYTLTMRLVTEVTDRMGQATLTDLRSTTWEHGEGRSFHFDSSHYSDEQLTETTSGTAERMGANGVIEVRIEEPTPSQRELPGDVIFPTQHTFAVLSAALEGRSLVQTPVFDGSEKGEKVYHTTAFIGRRHKPGEDERSEGLANEEKLAELPSWPVAIGYFDSDGRDDAAPAYELTFRLYANGVSRDLTIDYGDFAIRGSLSALDFLPPTRCP